MRRIAALAGLLTFFLGTLALPALARTDYVQDGAGLFSSATVSTLDARIGDFANATGKEVVVVTVPSLGGQTLASAAENAFASQRVNGILIYIAKAEHSDYIVGDRAAHAIFPAREIAHIRDAMNASFRQGDFNGGVTTAVNLVLDTYGSHAPQSARSAPYAAGNGAQQATGGPGGLHVGFLWWILIIVAIFWVVRALLRSAGGFGQGAGGVQGPGSGPGPGYGYGGGWGGWGGGGFWSGLLGGLGGAWLGNELFGGRGQMGNVGTAGSFGDPNQGAANDAGAFQYDGGQADMTDASGGSWGGGDAGGGDPGGGWGGGDAGGGWGGGDSGGGGW